MTDQISNSSVATVPYLANMWYKKQCKLASIFSYLGVCDIGSSSSLVQLSSNPQNPSNIRPGATVTYIHLPNFWVSYSAMEQCSLCDNIVFTCLTSGSAILISAMEQCSLCDNGIIMP